MTYDAENRLTSVSGGTTASFIYDGDGVRVKGTAGGVTTAYVGNYFEWKTSTSDMVKYYYAGGTRVAMRVQDYDGSHVFFITGDHDRKEHDSGSTSVTTDANGTRAGLLL